MDSKIHQGHGISRTACSAKAGENHTSMLAHEEYIVINLCNFSQDAITAVLSNPHIRNSDTKAREWQEIRNRLKVWEKELSVMEGKLDQMFIRIRTIRHLQKVTYLMLCGIAVALSNCVKLMELPWSYRDVLGDIADTITTLVPDIKEDLELPYKYYYTDTGDMAEDIKMMAKSRIDGLFEILPSAKEAFLSDRPKQFQQLYTEQGSIAKSGQEEKPSAHMSFFKTSICNKFPLLPKDLVLRLAKLNCERLLKIQDLKLQHSKYRRLINFPRPESFTSASGVSSTDNGGIQNTTIPVSATSKSLVTVHESINERVPLSERPSKIPFLETTFHCPICYTELKGIQSGYMWKKHILEHLEPYNCLSTSGNCSESNITFDSTDSWLSHEFQHHHPEKVVQFVCQKPCPKTFKKRSNMVCHVAKNHLVRAFSVSEVRELVDMRKKTVALDKGICPFCQDEIEETKSSIGSHIGSHLDEVALMVLPLDIDILSQIIDRSANPHNPQIDPIGTDTNPGVPISQPHPTLDKLCHLIEGCKNSLTLVSNQLEHQLHILSQQVSETSGPENSNLNTKDLEQTTNPGNPELSTMHAQPIPIPESPISITSEPGITNGSGRSTSHSEEPGTTNSQEGSTSHSGEPEPVPNPKNTKKSTIEPGPPTCPEKPIPENSIPITGEPGTTNGSIRSTSHSEEPRTANSQEGSTSHSEEPEPTPNPENTKKPTIEPGPPTCPENPIPESPIPIAGEPGTANSQERSTLHSEEHEQPPNPENTKKFTGEPGPPTRPENPTPNSGQPR
ncbi:hypothetical protein HOY82DRAFT_666706 [Tuber indicum]|nr:hypothetical protein HOY82DRAFT_666706 [Tuber indicum]